MVAVAVGSLFKSDAGCGHRRRTSDPRLQKGVYDGRKRTVVTGDVVQPELSVISAVPAVRIHRNTHVDTSQSSGALRSELFRLVQSVAFVRTQFESAN